MEISKDRLQHSLAVARRMREIVMENPEDYDISAEDAFTLGYVHDLGYEFCDEQLQHAEVGARILREQGFKYWQEVKYHGSTNIEYKSSALKLLNFVDMTTSPNGEYITMEERLDDIALRYGQNSMQYLDAVELSLTLV